MVSLLPEPANLLPGLLVTAAMAVFYILRLIFADKFKIRGVRSFGDYALGALTFAELAALAVGVRQRQQAAAIERRRRGGGGA